jgi:membrane protein
MRRFGAQSKLRLTRAAAWMKDLIACVDNLRTFGLAAETAFWLFLSLIPLAAVAGLIAARFSVNNWGEATPVLSSLPTATRQLISTELMTLASRNDGTAGVWSAVVFIWLASSGVHSIFDSLELQVGTTRPWWKKRLLAIGACVALSVAVALLAILGPGLSGAMGWLGRWIPELRMTGEPTMAGNALRFGVSAAIVFGYICGLYRIGIPPSARRHLPVVPGALLAVGLELLFGFAYAVYVAEVGDGGAYLAGLAVIGVTMIGLYLFTAALLTGAVVNRKLRDDRDARRAARSAARARGEGNHTLL